MARRSVVVDTTDYHRYDSPTLRFEASKSLTFGGACICDRCGAARFPDMGERMPSTCTPTPQWLRAHPDVTKAP